MSYNTHQRFVAQVRQDEGGCHIPIPETLRPGDDFTRGWLADRWTPAYLPKFLPGGQRLSTINRDGPV